MQHSKGEDNGRGKKTVLFIVEGNSDKSALEKIFQKIYRMEKNIVFRFTGGDISSDENVTTGNVEDKIYNVVQEFIKEKKLRKNDIYEIVQIFDTDGAYISEDAIVEGDSDKFIYSTTSIECNDIEKVKKRNVRKSAIMNFLFGLKTVKSIPYEVYYMSCNLDHALYDQQNLDKDLKQQYADDFYEKFIGKEKLFSDFLKTDVANGVPEDYLKSWIYIREELHSLERHSNLQVFFQLHPFN